MKEKMGINERFETIIKELYGNNQSSFAKAIGVTPTVIANVVGTRRGKPSFDVMEKVCANANISPDWLITGTGEMLKRDASSAGTPSADAVISNDKGTKNIRVTQEKDVKSVPLVSQTVAAGFGNENFAIAEADVKDYYTIPRFRHTHVDFMIEVTGDSMTPHLNSGDIIACTIVRDSHFIQWNKCHVIATAEQGLLVKRLMPGTDENHLRAVSDNTRYPAFDIPKNEITGLALVIGSVCLE